MGLFSLITGIFGGNGQKKAADQAAQLQNQAAMAGIAETQRQFDSTRADFAPYQGLGTAAVPHLSDLLGLNGADGQNAEIEALKASPMYQQIYKNGIDARLAAASATGGMRGGNTQDSLARFGGDSLSNVIAQQIANYGGAVGVGSGATGAVGNFGANAVAQSNDLRNQGAGALAQAQLVKAGINAKNWQNAGSTLDNAVSSFLPTGSVFKKLF